MVLRQRSIKGMQAFSIRVRPEVKKALEDMAYEERKSLGWLVSEILEAAADKREPAAEADELLRNIKYCSIVK